MFQIFQRTPDYDRIDQQSDRGHGKRLCSTKNTTLRLLAAFGVVVIVCFTGGWMIGMNKQHTGASSQIREQNQRCKSPYVRREWRSLSTPEKAHYIRAVKCLLAKPSKARSNGSLYDDYPYIHARVGGHVHNAAPFLPWHRYFLHIYERNLQTICAYNGSLPYWDWTLDWESLTDSPVFSNTTGFGGDGGEKASESVGGGHCVVDGPFSDLVLPFYNSDDHEHCLSRAFADGNVRGRLPGDKVRPSVVEEVLSQADFKSFFTSLEKGPHNQIPNGIGGDFLKFTAPNDPLFFLHHCQLDRLWWLWQRANPQARQYDYGGVSAHNSKTLATLQDVIHMGNLSPPVYIHDMMDTEVGMLCYTY